jgi:hypothetical protein
VARKKSESNRITSPVGHARAVPIGDHGFLSDGQVSALLAPNGSVDWMLGHRDPRTPEDGRGPASVLRSKGAPRHYVMASGRP